jgi:hypothetical protein
MKLWGGGESNGKNIDRIKEKQKKIKIYSLSWPYNAIDIHSKK